jgi:deferrochelatase/peroxidase EfeB
MYSVDKPSLNAALHQRGAQLTRNGQTAIRTIHFKELFKSAEPPAGAEENALAPQIESAKPKKTPRPWARDVFGFVDGVSQPIIKGTRRWASIRDRHHMVSPGEIVLGYPDNRGYLPPSPSVAAADDPDNILPPLGANPFRDRPDFSHPQPTERRDVGRSGTFLVVRQLEQDKAAFEKFLQETADELGNNPRAPPDDKNRREWIAAKLVGRWRDGTSLVRYPHKPGTEGGKSAPPDNDFLYGTEDSDGLRCPFGAHIRRANPRDSMGPGSEEQIKISNRHRILRVGRAYDAQDGVEKPGLFFMGLNADIERQFEFVQQTWTGSRSFHGLDDEVDCFSPRGAQERFTIPTVEGPLCLRRLSDFVTVRGGGYFFLPGRRFLRYLATDKRKVGGQLHGTLAGQGAVDASA